MKVPVKRNYGDCSTCKVKTGGSGSGKVNCQKYNPVNVNLDCLNWKRK